MKLAATHPAKATAACPEGIPPANEFEEWVSALPRRTMSTTTPSVTSVRWAGWRLMLSRVQGERPQIVCQDEITDEHSPVFGDQDGPRRDVLGKLGQRMIFPRGKVDDEFHGCVEQLRHEDQEYGQNKDREFQLPDSDQQARCEDQDGHDDVEAHVALGADSVDHTPVGVLEAAGHALLALAWLLNFPRHATPPLRPAGASPSHWP